MSTTALMISRIIPSVKERDIFNHRNVNICSRSNNNKEEEKEDGGGTEMSREGMLENSQSSG